MKKNQFFLLMMLGLLTLSFIVFYQIRLRYMINPGLGVPVEKPAAPGEVIITYSDPGRSKEILRVVVLNRMIVEDFELNVVEVDGEKKPLLKLNMSFKYNGKDSNLTIIFIDTINLRKSTGERFKDEGEKSVATLSLAKGSTVNIALSYIPKDIDVEKETLVSLCEVRAYEPCLRYIKLGFGEEPIDFSQYLDQVLVSNQIIDYKLAFPVSIFVLESQ